MVIRVRSYLYVVYVVLCSFPRRRSPLSALLSLLCFSVCRCAALCVCVAVRLHTDTTDARRETKKRATTIDGQNIILYLYILQLATLCI